MRAASGLLQELFRHGARQCRRHGFQAIATDVRNGPVVALHARGKASSTWWARSENHVHRPSVSRCNPPITAP